MTSSTRCRATRMLQVRRRACMSCGRVEGIASGRSLTTLAFTSALPLDSPPPAEDLFRHLDTQFARNNTLTQLVALHPSVRVDSRCGRLIECVHERAPCQQSDLPSRALLWLPSFQRRLPAGVVSTIWKHYFHQSLSCASSASVSSGVGVGLSACESRPIDRTASLNRDSEPDPPRPRTPSVEDDARELMCAQWLVTDVLRHDLACLKERHDEVLSAQHTRSGEHGGTFSRNLEPVMTAIREEVQRLNHMPIEYLARMLLREMKEDSADNDDLRGASLHDQRRSSGSIAPIQSPPPPPPQLNTILVPDSPTLLNPLDKLIAATAHPSPRSHPGTDLPPPPSARLSPLTPARFASHIDAAMKSVFDRYYRKGFWLLFWLNLANHQKQLDAHEPLTQQSAHARHVRAHHHSGSDQSGWWSSGGGGGNSGGGLSWSDRIGNALAANERDSPATLLKSRPTPSPAPPGRVDPPSVTHTTPSTPLLEDDHAARMAIDVRLARVASREAAAASPSSASSSSSSSSSTSHTRANHATLPSVQHIRLKPLAPLAATAVTPPSSASSAPSAHASSSSAGMAITTAVYARTSPLSTDTTGSPARPTQKWQAPPDSPRLTTLDEITEAT